MLGCEGRLQREGAVIHVIAQRLLDLTPALRRIGERGTADHTPASRLKVKTRDFR